MTTIGRWSPNKVRARVLDGTWVSTEELGGMVLLTPTSIAYSGTSASIGANGSVEFSAVSQLRLNGVFSADYDNYLVAQRQVYSTTTANILYVRFSVGGTDNSTASSYVQQNLNANGTTVSAIRNTADIGRISLVDGDANDGFVANVYGPYLAQPTAWRSIICGGSDGARFYDYAGTHNQSTSYDGFNITVDTGSVSGLVSVYGLVGA